MIAAYKVMPEDQLQNLLNRMVRPWQQSDGKMPSELDKEVLLIFAAAPGEDGLAAATTCGAAAVLPRHARLPPAGRLADAVVGHTAG